MNEREATRVVAGLLESGVKTSSFNGKVYYPDFNDWSFYVDLGGKIFKVSVVA